jgi:hypothetical protein
LVLAIAESLFMSAQFCCGKVAFDDLLGCWFFLWLHQLIGCDIVTFLVIVVTIRGFGMVVKVPEV